MFKVAEKRIVSWLVRIHVPQDGGKVRTHEVEVRFEHLPESEFNAFYTEGGGDGAMIRRAVQGWKEGQFQHADGSDMAFSPESLDRLFEDSVVFNAFIAAYIEIRQGREAARKN